MSPFGVEVSMLEPGNFKTNLSIPDLQTRQMNGLWSQLDENLKSDYGEEYLQKRECVYIRERSWGRVWSIEPAGRGLKKATKETLLDLPCLALPCLGLT